LGVPVRQVLFFLRLQTQTVRQESEHFNAKVDNGTPGMCSVSNRIKTDEQEPYMTLNIVSSKSNNTYPFFCLINT
jgi:hypothetical protein